MQTMFSNDSRVWMKKCQGRFALTKLSITDRLGSRPWLLSVLLPILALTACKPKLTSESDQTSGSPQTQSAGAEATSSDKPRLIDVAAFLRSASPPFAQVTDVKMDAPVILPNTSPSQRAWLCNVRFAFTPTEDLFGLAPGEPARAVQAAGEELANWSRWQAAYERSPYARLYPAFDLPIPAAPPAEAPVLALLHKANQSMPPIYGQLSAEWQVNHWRFAPVDLNIPEAGVPRSSFASPNVVLGSAEAAAFQQAAKDYIAQARAKKADLDARYVADLVQSVLPGTLYRGQINHRGSVVPAEVRFLPPPAGAAAEPQTVGLEIRLPATPGETFTYSARLSQELPLDLGASPETSEPARSPDHAGPLPKGDLRLSFVSATGKEGVYSEAIPVALLNLQRHYTQPDAVWLRLSEHRLTGRLNGFVTDPTGFVLSAQLQTSPTAP